MNLAVLTRQSLKTRITLATLGIFVASLWMLSIAASRMLRSDMERLLGDQQFSTVSLLANQLNRELTSRIKALEVTGRASAQALRSGPAAVQEFIEQRPVLAALFNAGIAVYDTNAMPLADLPLLAVRNEACQTKINLTTSVLKQGESVISAPVIGESKSPRFCIAAPIRDAGEQVVGAFLGVVDLGRPNFLDQTTDNPYARTGGYLLISPETRQIISATDKSRVMERFPAEGTIPLLDRFLRGDEGSGIATNPHGVELLASAKAIPAAGWVIAATLPIDEAFAPIRELQQRMLLATTLMTLLSGMLTWWILRRQLAPLTSTARSVAALSLSQAPLQPLPIGRHDEIGQLLAGFNQLLDTLRRREESLRESETFKSVILNSMAAEIAVLDRDGVIVAVNERWLHFSLENGIEPGTHVPRTGVGSNYLSACGGDENSEGAEARRGIQAVLDGRLPGFTFEYRCHSTQQERWFAMIVTPLGSGHDGGVVIAHTNTSELKKAERSIAEQYATLQLRDSALAAVSQGVMITSADRLITYINAGFEKITGYCPADILGRSGSFLHGPESDPETLTRIAAAVESGELFHGRILNYRKDGSVFWNELSISPVFDENGCIQQFIGVLHDVTEQKKIEDVQNFLASISSGPSNEPFFEALARFLSTCLDMFYVCIDRLEGDGLNARTLAIWCDGHFEDNVTYALKDTPCGKVVGSQVCCFPTSVSSLFPNDPVLQTLKADSYVGVTLWNHTGQAIGLIAVIGRSPLSNRPLAESVLKLVSARAAGELERLQAEEALRDSHETLGSILATTRDGFLCMDRQGALLDVNPAYCRQSGYSREKLLGMNIQMLDVAEGKTGTDQHLQNVVMTGGEQFETLHRRKDGSLWHLEVSATYRNASGGEIHAFTRDITDRKHSENELELHQHHIENLIESRTRELEDANQRLTRRAEEIADLYDHAPCGYHSLSPDGTIIAVNETELALLGYAREEYIGRKIFEFMSRESIALFRQRYSEFSRTGRIRDLEFDFVRKDGTIIPLLASGDMIRDANGEFVATRSTLVDNRERKIRDEKIAVMQVELAQRAEAAEAANLAKSAFLANMSHEIRTPMNAILGMATILRRSGLTREQAERLDRIDTAGSHLLGLITNILDLSKIEAGKFVVEELPVNVSQLMHNVCSMLSERACAKGISLKTELCDLPPDLHGDATRLQQAVLNYATNAIKFSEKGTVTLRVLKQEQTRDDVLIRFEVQDEGIGIAPDTVPRLFRAFEQADNSTTRKYGGSGLGLAITRRLAELMGGEVGVNSTEHVGSTFWLSARLKRRTPRQTESACESAVDAERLIQREYSGRRVLLVDDEPVNLDITLGLLKETGLAVDTAEDGYQALSLARKNVYDLILMDMQMPVLDGLAATRQLRAMGNYRNTPILAMTANAFAEDKAQCFAAGMNDFLVKPLEPGLLFSTLLKWLRYR